MNKFKKRFSLTWPYLNGGLEDSLLQGSILNTVSLQQFSCLVPKSCQQKPSSNDAPKEKRIQSSPMFTVGGIFCLLFLLITMPPLHPPFSYFLQSSSIYQNYFSCSFLILLFLCIDSMNWIFSDAICTQYMDTLTCLYNLNFLVNKLIYNIYFSISQTRTQRERFDVCQELVKVQMSIDLSLSFDVSKML